MNMAELVKLQPQRDCNVDINPVILDNFSPHQREAVEIGAVQLAERMPLVTSAYKISLALFGPHNFEITESPTSDGRLANWDYLNIGTLGSYVTVYSDKDGYATFSVVNDSKPRDNDGQRIPRSFRRPKVSSTLNFHEDAKIVGRNLKNYLLARKLALSPDTVVEGPTDDEPFVVVRKRNGMYAATYEQENGGVYEVQGMVFEPTINIYNMSVHGSVSLLGKKRN